MTIEAVQALEDSRVDLVDRIRHGIPEVEFIPGGDPWLIAGKRYLLPAAAGTGKSLVGLVAGVDVVAAGGSVVILDVENGADEYARRLDDVLQSRPDGLAEACSARLRYHEWPHLKTTWSAEDWVSAFVGVDLVIFDSSRLLLSKAQLAEDDNDDYAIFVAALLAPLSEAGITTLVLDNTGHEEKGRARGASAKADLNEVVYVATVGKSFGQDRHGHVRLRQRRSRFSGLPRHLRFPLGEGQYGPIEIVDDEDFRPTVLMQRVSERIESEPGIGSGAIRRTVTGNNEGIDEAVRQLAAGGFIEVTRNARGNLHHSLKPFRDEAAS